MHIEPYRTDREGGQERLTLRRPVIKVLSGLRTLRVCNARRHPQCNALAFFLIYLSDAGQAKEYELSASDSAS